MSIPVQPLSPADVLDLWQAGAPLAPAERALVMLRHAAPEYPVPALASLPIGCCDALLLRLRQAALGDALNGVAPCPRCGETLEFALSCERLLGTEPGAPDPGRHLIEADGYRIVVRLPSTTDLVAAGRCPNLAQATQTLLSLCVVEAAGIDGPVDVANLPAAVVDAIGEALRAADPGAETLLDLVCPGCGHDWQALFDVTRYFWTEIVTQAQRLLLEVDALARAYGWREADILALPPVRRAAYLELVRP